MILTLYKPKYIFETLVNPLKFQIIFIMLHFFFNKYKRLLYGILTLEKMLNIMIIIKTNYINFWLRG